MGIFTTKGFFSVVEEENDPDQVLIRSRLKKDIQSLKRLFNALGLKTEGIIVNARSDYKYRFMADRMDWILVMTRLMLDLNYRNFKDAVYKVDSREFRDNRHEAYFQVWTTMRKLQLLETI